MGHDVQHNWVSFISFSKAELSHKQRSVHRSLDNYWSHVSGCSTIVKKLFLENFDTIFLRS